MSFSFAIQIDDLDPLVAGMFPTARTHITQNEIGDPTLPQLEQQCGSWARWEKLAINIPDLTTAMKLARAWFRKHPKGTGFSLRLTSPQKGVEIITRSDVS